MNSNNPKRIQRRRVRGWRKPAGAVIVDRTSRWGNPYCVERNPNPGALAVCAWRVWTAGPPGHDWEYFATKSEANARAVALYRQWIDGSHGPWNGQNWINIAGRIYSPGYIREQAPVLLRGRDLACWCPLDQPCHADVLLEIANASERGRWSR